MSASLVGSEMCIRDRISGSAKHMQPQLFARSTCVPADGQFCCSRPACTDWIATHVEQRFKRFAAVCSGFLR
eukprot:4601633-Alexandrium_andersonii.AAC.1